MMFLRFVVLLVAVVPATSAQALTLSQVDQTTPWPGIVITQYRTSDPATDVWVAEIDLCAEYVRVEATSAPSSYQTASAWGSSAGLQLATNGDFYSSGPSVYGDAIGGALRWPLDQTGLDPSHASEWFYERHGWIAFGHDWVDFTHTEWVKQNASIFGIVDGWEPTVVAPSPPMGTISLVSGFPELVVEGQVITCPSPTDSSCFPDRSDMRDRHPRTAMGLTANRQTFLLVVVDGRTSQATGMYGAELADLMGQLGAYVAFNLDGGGSTQMWVDGQGTINNASGNNGGGGLRSVANHWGVFAGSGSGVPLRPAHCASEPACQTIPPPGDILESDGPCAWLFGSDTWWREETTGYGGHLYWTNAFTSAEPSNWAWWQLHFEQAGEYLVEVWVDDIYGVYDNARYEVLAAGQSSVVHLNQGAAAGWREIGAFQFAQGGAQFLAVYDNTTGAVPSDQHVSVDAISLTRLGSWCGDGTCDADEGVDENCFTCPGDCPAVVEIPGNGIDDDCNGEVDEEDCGPEGCDAGASADTDADATELPGSDGGTTGDSPTGGCHCSSVPMQGAPVTALLWLLFVLVARFLVVRRRTA